MLLAFLITLIAFDLEHYNLIIIFYPIAIFAWFFFMNMEYEWVKLKK